MINCGAIADGRTDNKKAFLRAWNDACYQNGGSIVYIPKGVYMVGSVEFAGPCRGPIMFLISGDLKAPIGPYSNVEKWIGFQHVNNLIVKGGGTLDGQGPSAWPYNKCQKTNNCDPLPISIKFDFVTNSRIESIRSVNSKNVHLAIYGCNNVNVSKVDLLAPADSPNTDGIKISRSADIRITNSRIRTGDDCIAIISGSSNIDVSYVYCGPGHGISIGSLGKYKNEENVNGVTVRKCTLSGTDNGVRIKSWESPYAITASRFLFQDIFMENVRNPIIIDQTYCPHSPCNQETASHVQIQDVTYRNIWGTSSSQVAVSFECSKKFPCKNIVMTDVNLASVGGEGPLKSSCSYVKGRYFGRQNPPPCF
ncbi:exopolygalacturonase-like [Gossypium australe]|uniref:Polygalacturonase n=1 Tax=Gossypium australe TaxID=47621 RepID=A0A5B6UGJ2_9ROSI|nr:exopolygalacturonase-like [Gossypium australe]